MTGATSQLITGRLIEGRGTPETAWLPFLEELAPPPLALTPAPRRAVVIAPHPDDEVLGVGGLLTLLHRVGAAIHIIAVTDGEASHFRSTAITPAELARRRAAETVAALAALGLRVPIRRLSLPDGGGEGLTGPVVTALTNDDKPDHPVRAGDWLLAPWTGDGHPDHDAVGRAAATVAERTGAQLLAYPIWAWHWALPIDATIPWDRAEVVRLPADVHRAKLEAMGQFHTQLEPLGPDPADAPVLTAEVVARFARPFEVVFR